MQAAVQPGRPGPIDLNHAPYAGLQLNAALDVPTLAARFQDAGRIQIESVLTPPSADMVYELLARQTPWGLASWEDGKARFYRREELARMSPEERAAIRQRVMREARDGYQFLYHCFPMLNAFKEGWGRGHPLIRFLEFINTDVVLDLVRAVTGVPSLIKADAQATFYAPNDFLNQHNDFFPGEEARIAYVFGFTKSWNPNWGGYTQFFDEAGQIACGLAPRFNVLTLFRIPVSHSVAPVAPFAGAPRLSITGWFRDR